MKKGAIFITGLLFLFLLPCLSYGNQNPYVVTEEKDEYDLSDHIYVWKDVEGTADLKEVLSQNIQDDFELYTPPLEDIRGIYWGRISIQNDMPTPGIFKDWILRLGEGSFIDIYILNENGDLIEQKQTGEWVPNSKKDFRRGNKTERIKISLPQNGTITLYIRLQKINGHPPQFHPFLLQQKDFYNSESFIKEQRRNGLFFGFLITMVILHFLLYFATKDLPFFYHFLFLLGISIFLLGDTGIIWDTSLFSENPLSGHVFLYFAQALMDIGYILFIRSFMDLSNTLPKWDRILKWLIVPRVLVFLITILFFLYTTNEVVADQITISFVVIEYLIIVSLMYVLGTRKEKKSYFLIVATLLLIFGVFANIASILSLQGVEKTITQISVIALNFCFTLGLAYRMSNLFAEQRAAQRLRDINDFKDRLYTNITHEFRTPLTVINGMAEQLKKGGHSKEAQNKSLNLIQKNGQQLLEMINQILDLTRLESSKMALNLEQGDIIAYLRYLVNSISSLAHSKNQQLLFLTELESLKMDFDVAKMRQVILNLLSNAIKFTEDNGKISLTAKRELEGQKEFLYLKVKDNGIGIAEKDLDHIFNRYFQSTSSPKQEAKGSGIGLTLVSELIKLMNGNIEVKSKLGEGTSFEIWLPIERKAQPNLEKDWFEENKLNAEIASNNLIETGSPTTSEKPILLIVEDSWDIIQYLQTLLKDHYTIQIASNGNKGIDKALEIIPDLILSDIMMPEKDGFELCEALKNDERTSHIPIILLTAKATVKDRIAGLSRGADAYLAKPFNEQELFLHLQNLLQARKNWQKHFQTPETIPETEDQDLKIEDAFLKKLNELIHAHMDEDISIPQLCRWLGMSRTQLHRKITALTNRSTSIYVRSIRLHHAKSLLQSTDMNVSEIAYEVGFKDPNYFTRTFVEEFGIQPSSLRR